MELASESFTGQFPGPHVLITGGVHGDEWEPMAAARRLACDIRVGSLLCGRVTIVPVVNEAAFCRGSRTADDGLDLARTCPGRADGSITEQVAYTLSALIRSADYYIDLHTGGTRLRVLPLVGYVLHPNPVVLTAQRRMARAFGLPIVWGTDPSLEGRSLSVARDANVPAIYAEYQGGGACDPAGVTAYVDGCLGVLADLGMVLPRPPRSQPAPIVVEDDRHGSGHMQTGHPSPCEGFFEPAVGLGESVVAGQRLGTVTDVLGRSVIDVCATHAGLVLVLHTFARVEAGVGLAVVLPRNLP